VPEYPFVTLRVVLGPETLLGVGKADLLAGIAGTGSIAAGGCRMRMSYKRTWYLIDTLNGYFRAPLVTSTKGGRTGGGAALTETGKVVAIPRRLDVNQPAPGAPARIVCYRIELHGTCLPAC